MSDQRLRWRAARKVHFLDPRSLPAHAVRRGLRQYGRGLYSHASGLAHLDAGLGVGNQEINEENDTLSNYNHKQQSFNLRTIKRASTMAWLLYCSRISNVQTLYTLPLFVTLSAVRST